MPVNPYTLSRYPLSSTPTPIGQRTGPNVYGGLLSRPLGFSVTPTGSLSRPQSARPQSARNRAVSPTSAVYVPSRPSSAQTRPGAAVRYMRPVNPMERTPVTLPRSTTPVVEAEGEASPEPHPIAMKNIIPHAPKVVEVVAEVPPVVVPPTTENAPKEDAPTVEDDAPNSLAITATPKPSLGGGGGGVSSLLRTFRSAGNSAMSAVRLQKMVPWASIDLLKKRGIDVSNIDRILDSFTRFIFKLRGKLMMQRMRRQAPSDNPFVEWRDFSKGNLSVLQTVRITDRVYFSGDVLNVSLVEFTLSHFRLALPSGEYISHKYASIAALDSTHIESTGRLIIQLRTSTNATRPDPLTFGHDDAPAVLSALVARLSHRFQLGSAIMGGFMKKGLRIVHFNDVYHLTPFKNPRSPGLIGGASRFLTKLREIQTTHNPLILFSGDFMSPSLMSVLMKGKHMIDAFNLIGVHYGTFGNHEFDYGMAHLKDCIHGYVQGNFVFAGSNTQWIMSNMSDGSGAPLGGVLSRASMVWNGTQVGLLGISENWLPQCNQLAKGESVYYDMFETAERMAQDLKREGAEVVIVLAHSRYESDKELTEKCPTVDLVLGGHDHFYKNSPKHRVIKSGEEFEFLTEAEVVIDPETKAVKCLSTAHPITKDIEVHPSMEAIISRYEKRLQARMGRVIGTNSVPLDCTEATCRFREGLLPGFITDVMASRAKADFAILGGAAIAGKNIKPPGDITVGDVFNWFPNDTRIMTVKIKGSTVQKMLNVMVKEVPFEAPSFPHPSGNLSFVINTMRSPTIVDHIKVRGEPLDPDREYTVAVETFVGLGKAKYKFIPKEGIVVADDESAEQITFWILEYFESNTSKKEREKNYALLSNSVKAHKRFTASLLKNSASIKITNRIPFGDLLKATPPLTSDEISCVLRESAKVLRAVPNQIETLMFQMEVALKQLGGVDSVRVFHVATGDDGWYRTDSVRRVHAPKLDRYGFACCAKEGTILLHENNDSANQCPLDYTVETTLSAPPTSFVCIPVKNNLGMIAVVVLAKSSGPLPTHSQLLQSAEYILQVAGPLEVLTRKEEDLHIDKQRADLIHAVSDIVQSGDNVTVNDKLANITKHAKNLFSCEKAYLYVLDNDEMWTVRRSITANRKVEDVVLRKDLATCGVLSLVLGTQKMMRFDNTNVPEGEPVFERNCLCVPVYRPRSTDEMLGILVLSDKFRGEFSDLDKKIAADYVLFAAIAVNTSTELEVLRTGVDRTKLRIFPVLGLDRIRFKRGWGSVKARLRYICSNRYKMIEERRANGEDINESSLNLSPDRLEEPPADLTASTLAV